MRKRRRPVRMLALGATLVAVTAAAVATAQASEKDPGFLTTKAAMLTGVADGVEVTPLITVGETLQSGYRFESIPDGIALATQQGKDKDDDDDGEGKRTRKGVDVFVNHETSLVPFPPTRSDFTNALLSRLTLNRKTGGVLTGEYAIPSSANYQRFCSSFLVTKKHGFERDLLFANEEARDWVNRTGTAWPATPFAPGAEQAGVVVAYDVETGQYRSIYGMGRHNHENAVALPEYDRPVILSGDDTFDAPASQLYLYRAKSGEDVWNDKGRLYAFVPDDLAINDYGDLKVGDSVSGHFIEVPRMIATGKKLDGSEVKAADFGFPSPPSSIPDGPQWVLEHWSNVSNVFQFIRIEDIAYDREDENVVYLADTGEPLAKPDATTTRLKRDTTGGGPYPNGRIFKLVLDEDDPLEVESLSILIDGDALGAAGAGNVSLIHQPDNLETTKKALLIQEDPGSQNRYALPEGPGKTTARIWKYDLESGKLDVVARVDQSSDGSTPKQRLGNWESSGIVDASRAFGEGMFLVDVQAHGWEIETAPHPTIANLKFNREAGQLLLVKIPGT